MLSHEVYIRLGGVLDTIPLNIRGWDIEASGIAIELDEEQHFNRYRLTTLKSSFYSSLRVFPRVEYTNMCQQFEDECMRKAHHGGWWASSGSQKQFGPAGQEGDLTGVGAPRWKQRAFYDFVKDLTHPIIGVQSVRISLWDTVTVGGRETLLKDLLRKRNVDAAGPIWSLIESRL